MTEGYAPKTGTLDDQGAEKPVLTNAAADDVVDAMQFGMTYQNGKHRSRAADEIARKTVARMIYDHLTLAGYVIMKKPPSEPWSISGFKNHLTE